jgi:hypothetical protein
VKALVVDLSSSSDEEGLIVDTTCDEEFFRRHFGDLNRDVLGSPRDDKIIILSDSDEEEEEVREEKTISAKATPSFAAGSPTLTASTDVDDAPTGAQNDNSDDPPPPVGRPTVAAAMETKPIYLRAATPR